MHVKQNNLYFAPDNFILFSFFVPLITSPIIQIQPSSFTNSKCCAYFLVWFFETFSFELQLWCTYLILSYKLTQYLCFKPYLDLSLLISLFASRLTLGVLTRPLLYLVFLFILRSQLPHGYQLWIFFITLIDNLKLDILS